MCLMGHGLVVGDALGQWLGIEIGRTKAGIIYYYLCQVLVEVNWRSCSGWRFASQL